MGKKQKNDISWKAFCRFTSRHPWRSPLAFGEWLGGNITTFVGRTRVADASDSVKRLAWVLTLIGAICTIGFKFYHQDDSKKKLRAARDEHAWQIIAAAFGKPGDDGRSDALEVLVQDGVSLKGVSLADATISGPLNITNVDMEDADLSNCRFDGVNFSNTSFIETKWSGSQCSGCNFIGANFYNTDFNNAAFTECDFNNAFFGGCEFNFVTNDDVESMAFFKCNFVGADFDSSIWRAGPFQSCNLAYVNLGDVRINSDSSIFCCNLFGASNASPDFLAWGYHEVTAFTNMITLEEWISLVEGTNKYASMRNRKYVSWSSNQFIAYMGTNNPQA